MWLLPVLCALGSARVNVYNLALAGFDNKTSSSPACPLAARRSLEEAVYDEAGHEEECSKHHVVRALLRVNLDMTEKAAQQVGA